MWLKGLLAITCVAVLAAVGFYFWTEYQRSAESARRADVAEARDACLFMLDRYAHRDLNNPDAPAMLARVEGCLNDGMISAADINAAAATRR